MLADARGQRVQCRVPAGELSDRFSGFPTSRFLPGNRLFQRSVCRRRSMTRCRRRRIECSTKHVFVLVGGRDQGIDRLPLVRFETRTQHRLNRSGDGGRVGVQVERMGLRNRELTSQVTDLGIVRKRGHGQVRPSGQQQAVIPHGQKRVALTDPSRDPVRTFVMHDRRSAIESGHLGHLLRHERVAPVRWAMEREEDHGNTLIGDPGQGVGERRLPPVLVWPRPDRNAEDAHAVRYVGDFAQRRPGIGVRSGQAKDRVGGDDRRAVNANRLEQGGGFRVTHADVTGGLKSDAGQVAGTVTR